MMGFNLSELIIESIIRDGLQNVRNDPTIIDSVFAQLTRAYNAEKYGQAEITKIKNLVLKDIAVIHGYHEVDTKPLCYSIVIGSDNEHKPRAHLDDDYAEVSEAIVNPIELQALHRVDNLIVTAFDSLSGRVSVDPASDLSQIYKGMLYVDSIGTEHEIIGVISNALNDKFFFISKLDEVDFSTSTGFIKSSLNYKEYEIKGVTSDIQLVVGAHSKDALTTKYLYILLKYFILSRKHDLIKRDFYLASYSGSDFNRDSAHIGDQVFTRFLTINAKCDDTWRSDQVVLIDHVEIRATPID